MGRIFIKIIMGNSLNSSQSSHINHITAIPPVIFNHTQLTTVENKRLTEIKLLNYQTHLFRVSMEFIFIKCCSYVNYLLEIMR